MTPPRPPPNPAPVTPGQCQSQGNGGNIWQKMRKKTGVLCKIKNIEREESVKINLTFHENKGKPKKTLDLTKPGLLFIKSSNSVHFIAKYSPCEAYLFFVSSHCHVSGIKDSR